MIAGATPLFVFLHVPKTGGTSLRAALTALFGEERSVTWGRRDVRAADPPWTTPDHPTRQGVLMGHINFRHPAVAAVPNGRLVPISVFRDPVERAVSWYDYVRGYLRHPLHATLAGLSFREALRSAPVFRQRVILGQLTYVFGTRDPDKASRALAPRRYILGHVRDLDAFVGAVASVAGLPPPSQRVPRLNRVGDKVNALPLASEQPDLAEATALLRRLNEPEAAFIAAHLGRTYVSPRLAPSRAVMADDIVAGGIAS